MEIDHGLLRVFSPYFIGKSLGTFGFTYVDFGQLTVTPTTVTTTNVTNATVNITTVNITTIQLGI